MAEILKTPAARADLVEIWSFIANDDPDSADQFLDHIEEVLHRLSSNPGIGRRRESLGPNIRSLPVGNYVVYYQPMPDAESTIRLVRVLHGARDISPENF